MDRNLYALFVQDKAFFLNIEFMQIFSKAEFSGIFRHGNFHTEHSN
jgi:hypothetical protein